MYREIQTLIDKKLKDWGDSLGFEVYRNQAKQTAKFPYIIYSITAVPFGEQQPFALKIYNKDNGYDLLTELVDKISKELPIILKSNTGYVTLYEGNPFVQDLEEVDVQGLYVNFILETDFTE